MGSNLSVPSAFVEAEQQRWLQPHSLCIDTLLQVQQQPLVNMFKDDLYLCSCFTKCSAANGALVSHYFITDGTHMIQFGRPIDDRSVISAAVEISHDSYNVREGDVAGQNKWVYTEKSFKKTDDVVNRMKAVCGARGYSICLRNSEHVAKYIQSGSWVSSGMLPGGYWHKVFDGHITDTVKLLSTQLPVELIRTHVPKPVYPLEPSCLKFVKHVKGITDLEADEAYNIVFIGPTGCGKSHIINLLYNKTVCPSKASANSVTRNIHVTRGTINTVFDSPGVTHYPVNVFDCLGFCDSEIEASEVFAIIKQTIEATVLCVHKVVIVCSGRLEKPQEEAIRKAMVWLQFRKYPQNFTLLYTKCDGIDEAQRASSLAEVLSRLELPPSKMVPSWYPSAILRGGRPGAANLLALQEAVALPPQAPFNEIHDDFCRVLDAIFMIPETAIPVHMSEAACPIL